MRRITTLTLASLFAIACSNGGGSGKITGRVTVEGGKASMIAVEAVGPVSTAAVTDETGGFALEGLRDGWYLIRATVAGAEEPTKTAVVRVEKSAGETEPTLAFKVSAGKVSGKVVFSDASDASGIGVAVAGAAGRGTVTDATGAFSFDALPSGSYVLAVDVTDSREKHQSVTFKLDSAMPSVTLPDIAFVVTGTLSGTVKDAAMMPAPGVEVTVLGTDARAVTDLMGKFELTSVPAGMRSVVATRNGAVPQFVKNDVTVVKGTNPPLMMTLAAAMPPTGTVTGAVSFYSAQAANLITISALGSNATTSATIQGSFSLDVPAGDWDIVADAPFYPRLLLGHVTVKEGSTQALPAAHMTIFRAFGPETGLVSSLFETASDGDWFTYITRLNGATNDSHWVANAKTLSRRLFYYGPAGALTGVVLSRTGQHLAFNVGTAAYVINLNTGAQLAYSRAVSASDFSTDESVFFHADTAGSLMRITLAGATRKDFPGTQVFKVNRDRWFVYNGATQDVTLVTPTTDQVVFTSVNGGFFVSPIPNAKTNCVVSTVTTCTFKVLPPNSATSVTVAMGPYPSAAFIYNSSTFETGGDFASFYNGTVVKLLKMSDGSLIDLPANTSRIDFNETGTRVFYVSGTTGSLNVREEALPPTGASNPIATLTMGYQAQWVSPTRIIIFDEATAAPRRIEVKSGTATPDSNYILSSGSFIVPLAHWGKSSDSKRAALVADSNIFPIDIPYPGSGVSSAGGYEGLTLPGRWGAISDNLATAVRGTYVIDAVRNDIRLVPEFRIFPLLGVATAHAWYAVRPSSTELGFMTWTTDQIITTVEPGVVGLDSLPRADGNWFMTTFAPNSLFSRTLISTSIPSP